jgi:hypothetical protein
LKVVGSLGLWERELSRRLATRVIRYSVSDTMGAIGYGLYERGELLEELDATDDGSGGPTATPNFPPTFALSNPTT